MTKQNEIDTLRACAQTLGPDSYCGPWLLDQIPQIEAEIRSDLFPMVSYSEARTAQNQMREQAKSECERIIAQAKKEADRIQANAEKFDREIRARISRELHKILETI